MVKTRSGNIYSRVQNSSNEILSYDQYPPQYASRTLARDQHSIETQTNYEEFENDSGENAQALESYRSRRVTRRSFNSQPEIHPDVDVDFDRHNAAIRMGTLNLKIELIEDNCMLMKFDSMKKLQRLDKPEDCYDQTEYYPHMLKVCPEFESKIQSIAAGQIKYDINNLQKIFNDIVESSVSGHNVVNIVLAVLRSFDHMQVPSANFLYKTLNKPDKSKLISLSETDSTCSICLTDLLACSKIVKTNRCGHYFHEDCLRHWLNEKINCPLCRQHLSELFVRVEYRSYNI